jgi:hypothetical protein
MLMISRYFFFIFKSFVMSAFFPGHRRRRSWVSFIIVGCHNNVVVYAVYRCPLSAGVPLYYLAWLHKIVPAS